MTFWPFFFFLAILAAWLCEGWLGPCFGAELVETFIVPRGYMLVPVAIPSLFFQCHRCHEVFTCLQISSHLPDQSVLFTRWRFMVPRWWILMILLIFLLEPWCWHLWFKVKCPKKEWMSCHQFYYSHSCFPQDDCSNLGDPFALSIAIIRSKVQFVQSFCTWLNTFNSKTSLKCPFSTFSSHWHISAC